eukprot:5279573-Prymnesium_polylepis.1
MYTVLLVYSSLLASNDQPNDRDRIPPVAFVAAMAIGAAALFFGVDLRVTKLTDRLERGADWNPGGDEPR